MEILKKTLEGIASFTILFLCLLYAKSFYHFQEGENERLEILFLQFLGLTFLYFFICIFILLGFYFFGKFLLHKLVKFFSESERIDSPTQIQNSGGVGGDVSSSDTIDSDRVGQETMNFLNSKKLDSFNIDNFSGFLFPLFNYLENRDIVLVGTPSQKREKLLNILRGFEDFIFEENLVKLKKWNISEEIRKNYEVKESSLAWNTIDSEEKDRLKEFISKAGSAENKKKYEKKTEQKTEKFEYPEDLEEHF